jgi:hypothetical protein
MWRARLFLGALAFLPTLALGSCGGNGGGGQPVTTVDASDAGVESGDELYIPDIPSTEGGENCAVGLAGMMSDPVALCFQGDLLTAEIGAAYVKGQGVAQTWDDLGKTSGHAWQDDLGLASAIASFDCSAEYYGNAGYVQLDYTLGDLGLVFEKELATAPAGYDGEIYFRLRNAEAGYNYLNDAAHAALLRGVADAYGAAIQATYAQPVPGTGDGGSPGVVLGTPDPGGGFDYAPAEVIMGAAALLDMAILHASDPDAGSEVAAWQATAVAAVDYVWQRGRDPVTGLFYRSLVTSGDPGHDALLTAMPANDALLSDVQATAVLGLARVEDRYDTLSALTGGDDGGGLPDGAGLPDAALPSAEPYLDQADTILQAMAHLWDGSTDTATTSPGAFLEGVVPSLGGALMTNKTTISTAFFLGGVHRLAVVRGTSAVYVLAQLRAALLQATPGRSSLFTVITDSNGDPVQDGFLRASSKSWGYATVFQPEGGAGAEEANAQEYRADAINAVAEGLDQLWLGTPNALPCAP